MLFSFKNVVQKIRQIARRAVCSATAVVAAMEKKRRDSAFTKEQEIFIIKQFNCGLGPIEVRRACCFVIAMVRKNCSNGPGPS